MNIITRAEAKALGLKRYFTGLPCKLGHLAERAVVNWTCCECTRLKSVARYNADLEKSRERASQYYRENNAMIRAINAKSRAKNADKIKARKKLEYERDKHKPEYIQRRDAYAASVKDQKREYDKRYRAENAARLDAIKTAWRAENVGLMRAVKMRYKARRRAAEKAGDSSAEIHAWEVAAKKICHWCNRPCADEYHIDHYEPLAKGGKHEVSNLVIACPPCNLKKNAKDPYEFAATMGRLF